MPRPWIVGLSTTVDNELDALQRDLESTMDSASTDDAAEIVLEDEALKQFRAAIEKLKTRKDTPATLPCFQDRHGVMTKHRVLVVGAWHGYFRIDVTFRFAMLLAADRSPKLTNIRRQLLEREQEFLAALAKLS